MNVYLNGTKASNSVHKMYVQPGKEHDVSDWKDGEGNPRLLEVVFTNGVANVDDNLGKYLLDNKLAARSRLILPN